MRQCHGTGTITDDAAHIEIHGEVFHSCFWHLSDSSGKRRFHILNCPSTKYTAKRVVRNNISKKYTLTFFTSKSCFSYWIFTSWKLGTDRTRVGHMTGKKRGATTVQARIEQTSASQRNQLLYVRACVGDPLSCSCTYNNPTLRGLASRQQGRRDFRKLTGYCSQIFSPAPHKIMSPN